MRHNFKEYLSQSASAGSGAVGARMPADVVPPLSVSSARQERGFAWRRAHQSGADSGRSCDQASAVASCSRLDCDPTADGGQPASPCPSPTPSHGTGRTELQSQSHPGTPPPITGRAIGESILRRALDRATKGILRRRARHRPPVERANTLAPMWDAPRHRQLAGGRDTLRYVLHQLNRGELDVEDLKRNIEYAALVLETAYTDETRRLCDEDDDLAEATAEDVPDEVREWLAATFTRQAANKRPTPKFKSVANAIRMGVKFDRIFRKSTTVLAPIPPEIMRALTRFGEYDFSPFELNEATDGHALKYCGFHLFNLFGFLDQYRVQWQALDAFMLALEAGYSKHNNPYHNLVHACDVAQTSAWMLTQTGFANSLSDLECYAVIFAALIHDFEHTGHTNNFHVQSGSEFALLYNDRSVLENHHVSSCFRLAREPDKLLFPAFTREQYREFRNIVIDIVLATDMSTHFVQVKAMKNMLTLPEGIDKNKAMCLIVHACDISHPTKPFELHERWTSQLLEEFFRQGDLEASMGLPYSPLCDRTAVHIAESQIEEAERKKKELEANANGAA